ncbi:V-type ATP synthase subunit K [Angelakisella massiliensis]|uniref:V-type ATP synthase subunit K n=1 Tax=Angelakisella massiliensis TaxID=1871018 RepID=UPI0008F9095C|nr:V-type ATP synthase subunit K [Angelakisella massiliensis]
MEIIMNMGTFLAYAGVAIAVILSGMGSSKGVGYVGEAMSGVIAEDPGKFAQLLVLQALPATQGIYGFITGFLVIMKTGMLDGSIGQLTLGTGAYFFAACLPVAFVGYVSGKCQGRVAAAGVSIVAKRPDQVSKGMVAAAMVETYAILALLVSMLLIFNLPVVRM